MHIELDPGIELAHLPLNHYVSAVSDQGESELHLHQHRLRFGLTPIGLKDDNQCYTLHFVIKSTTTLGANIIMHALISGGEKWPTRVVAVQC